VGDATQKDVVTIHGFNILSKLNAERNLSPWDGVILQVSGLDEIRTPSLHSCELRDTNIEER